MRQNQEFGIVKQLWLQALGVLLAVLGASCACAQDTPTSAPDEFPHFCVPGHEHAMQRLRELYWLHYPSSAPPKPTLWDEWLSEASLWPATTSSTMRQKWSKTLSQRILDSEGYVASHHHASITHTLGWPFPMWTAGQGGWGWHFSFKDTVIPPFRPDRLSTQSQWKLAGVRDEGIGEEGWNLTLTGPDATIDAPPQAIDTFQAPFLQLRWHADAQTDAQPYVEWASADQPDFTPQRRFYFEPCHSDKIAYTIIPIFRHPNWKGVVDHLRIGLGNRRAGTSVTLQALVTHYDSRHNVNNPSFIHGCCHYFWWTGDLNFLRHNLNRMRLALCYLMVEHGALRQCYVQTKWPGHDGRSSLKRNPDGSAQLLYGHGIGNNYWDLLPFGGKDTYATLRYYDALLCMAQIEREVHDNPQWGMPGGALQMESEELLRHAEQVKAKSNRLFWNPRTGRFVGCIDADDRAHDYGFSFLNCEAIYYGLATPEHAHSIMTWLSGERLIKSDTSQGSDIYHWRFAPRTTTVRNLDYYNWVWSEPEKIPWGGQVQDGGAVLGFSYHDLMARLAARGADDAWLRLEQLLAWFDEVQAAGGYRKYYSQGREGTLQGGGTAGGLGMDSEFYESVLVPQVMLRGFLGFTPTGEGFRLEPQLPKSWPELTIDRIHWRDLVLRVRAARDLCEITKEGSESAPCRIELPPGRWLATYLGQAGQAQSPSRFVSGRVELAWKNAQGVRFERR